jgi:tRNA (guanosine-2'-O-)-methyltransferase
VASQRLVRMDSLDKLIELHGPDVVLAAITPLLTPERIARMDAVLDARLVSLSAVVEDLYDPHNGAAAIRSTEALGLQDFHVVEPNGRFSATKGVTKGCDRWVTLRRWTSIVECITHLRGAGFRVLATAPDARDDVEHVDVSTPIAVVFGNEHAGVSDAGVAACDGGLAIPMAGFTESFNLSVSVALVTSRLATRRREHLGARGDLPMARRAHLRARWAALRIRGAEEVIERHVSGDTRSDVAPGTHPGENLDP